MTAVKEWQKSFDAQRASKRPWGLLLIDPGASEEEIAAAWAEGSKDTDHEEAQLFIATPRDITSLGGDYKIPLVVVAFKKAHTKLHHQMVEYVEKHYPFVMYTRAAREALEMDQ